MKNRLIVGPITVIAGLLTAVGPQTLFRICEPSHHATVSSCFWTGQAVIGVGSVLAALGIAYIFFANEGVRAGISIAIAANALLTILLANLLIGMDNNAMMSCRLSTLPALNIISVLTIVLAAANAFHLLLKIRRGGATIANAATDSI
jgi:hypothetical protein